MEFFDSLQGAFSRAEWKPWLLISGFLVAVAIIFFGLAIIWLVSNRFTIYREFIYFSERLKGKKNQSSSRKKVSLPLTIFVGNTAQILSKTNTVDVSQNGMFIKTSSPLELNSEFDFELKLNKDVKVIGMAKVRWVKKLRNKNYPTGMGCQFMDISPEDRKKLLHLSRNS